MPNLASNEGIVILRFLVTKIIKNLMFPKLFGLFQSPASPTISITGLFLYLIKVKWSRYRPGVSQSVDRGIALLFHDRGTRRGWVVSNTPRPHFTAGKNPVPILQESGWAPGRVWRAENLVPTGIRPRTFQPVVSRYTDWATRTTRTGVNLSIIWPTELPGPFLYLIRLLNLIWI